MFFLILCAQLIPKFTQATKDICRCIKSRQRIQLDSLQETGAALHEIFSELRQSLQIMYSDGSPSPLPVNRGYRQVEQEEDLDELPSMPIPLPRRDLDPASVSCKFQTRPNSFGKIVKFVSWLWKPTTPIFYYCEHPFATLFFMWLNII